MTHDVEAEGIHLSGWVQQVGQVKHGAYDPLNGTSADLNVWSGTLDKSSQDVLVISSGDTEIAVLGASAVVELVGLLIKYMEGR